LRCILCRQRRRKWWGIAHHIYVLIITFIIHLGEESHSP
jgi:hypothetical protein